MILCKIPFDRYEVVIDESGRYKNKGGNGDHLKLEMRITHGEYAGFTLTDRINLWHHKSYVVDKAIARLNRLKDAVGVSVKSSNQLHGIPFIVTAATTTDGYNNVITYYPLDRVVKDKDFCECVSCLKGMPYDEYLKSNWWTCKRKQARGYYGDVCLARVDEDCTNEADHIHHLTYVNKGNEPLWDLRTICNSCHKKLHGK